MTTALIVLLLVAAERLGELILAHHNTKRLLAEGAHEVGAGHYPLIVAVHTGWLAALFTWNGYYPASVDVTWLVVYALIQIPRAWVMWSLGRFWTTRIISVANAPLVQRGPYKYIRHPNYVVVVLEIAVLPLVIGAWPVAVVFTLLNGVMLWVRIRVENAALSPRQSLG
jgi:methyltransferase